MESQRTSGRPLKCPSHSLLTVVVVAAWTVVQIRNCSVSAKKLVSLRGHSGGISENANPISMSLDL